MGAIKGNQAPPSLVRPDSPVTDSTRALNCSQNSRNIFSTGIILMRILLSRMNSSAFTNLVWPGVVLLGSNRYEWMPARTRNLSNLHLNSLGVFSCWAKLLRRRIGLQDQLAYLHRELDIHSAHINVHFLPFLDRSRLFRWYARNGTDHIVVDLAPVLPVEKLFHGALSCGITVALGLYTPLYGIPRVRLQFQFLPRQTSQAGEPEGGQTCDREISAWIGRRWY